ncbi:MAG: c-type cytochrome [Casimicrobiaceae bacterium]
MLHRSATWRKWLVPLLLLTSSSTFGAAPGAGGGAVLAQKGTAAGAPPCATCHGQNGEGNPAAGFPRLAGIGQPYLEAQLEAFASGTRANAVMAPIAKALLPAERRAAAAYYARLAFPIEFAMPADGPAPPAVGAMLALRGRWDRGQLPACVQCHGPDGTGVGGQFPPLAGQSAPYIAAQLRAWREGKRPPGPLHLMQAIATKLLPEDIDAVAQYFGTLQPRANPTKAKP